MNTRLFKVRSKRIFKTAAVLTMMVSGRISILLGQASPQEVTVLKGFTLGQKVPGMVPEIFAPGIVSIPGAVEYSGTFSPDGKEYYFYRFSETSPAAIYVSRNLDGKWTTPEPAGFDLGYPAYEPHAAFDNKTLYFAWQKPLPPGEPGNPNLPGIWAVQRTNGGWSAPEYTGQGMFVSSSRDGQMFITDLSTLFQDGKAYLVKVILKDGRFAGFERLTGGMDALRAQGFMNQAHPCIAPDGSFLLFDVEGGSHLFACFKKPDGTWGEAIDLARHGFDPKAGGASVSPDGKFLFFHLNGDIWWVDINVVENQRSSEVK